MTKNHPISLYLQGPVTLGENKCNPRTCMRPDSLYSSKQRFTYEDITGDDSELLLLTGWPQNP